MPSNCPKCGSSPTFSVVAAAAQYQGEPEAVVKMRGSVIIDTTNGPRRLQINERVSLPFGMMKAILDSEMEAVFYFLEEVDKVSFILLYPEYSTWNL